MAKIKVTNPKQIINGGAKKYYFKVKGVGGIKGDKGDKGDTGSQGPQGPQGNAATIEVGSTTTLPTGYDATVTNTGTINNAILNFGIPRGIKGDTGAKGDKGDKGDKGEQGNTGPQGPAGQNATVYIGTTTTGAPGTQASVYNSGTDRNAVLNFTIPQGPAGQDGQNFTPTIVETLPTTGDQSKLYLTPKNYTTGTATGNPITISLGEDAGAIESFQLDGDTFQQTYTGKNLLNLSASRDFISGTDYSFDASSGVLTVTMSSAPAVNRYSGWRVTGITAGAKYTFSIESFTNSALSNTDRAIMIRSHNGTSALELATLNKTQTSYTFTAPNDSVRLDFFFYIASGDTDSTSIITKPMLEAGETVTDYEPFVGGQPSPSPSYPQDINVVTGTQTISINGTNYPISLGSIELCKIGDYQDYVYKSGEKWYVHKESGKYVYNNDLGENGIGSTYVAMLTPTLPTLPNMAFTDGLFWCNSYTPTMRKNTGLQGTNASGRIRVNTSLDIADSYAKVRALAAANNLTIHYPLATATDTEITNTTLIAQLEAIRTASLQASNTITNTATGSNLAGDMELGYYGYNPTNRYDKFIWLDLNNAYEQLNNPDTSSTLSTLSMRSLGTTAEQPTVTRSLETETITLKKGEAEPIEDKTELPTILDDKTEETEEAETTEPEESDGTDER